MRVVIHAGCSVPVSHDVLIADLAPAQRHVWDALQEFCFNGPRCHPSQDMLAIRTGYTREYVNRIIRQLRQLGLLIVDKARRAGSRWTHNVYTLAFWVPPLRKKTLRNIAWIRAEIARVKRAVHTKGTPGAYSASSQRSTSVVSDLGSTSVVGRARSSLTNERKAMPDERYNPAKVNADPDENAPAGYDWLGQPKDPRIEALRKLTVDECDGCGPNGIHVRSCPIHGLKGTAPR